MCVGGGGGGQGGGVVPMSVKYYLVPLEKGQMRESVVFFCKHIVLNVMAF